MADVINCESCPYFVKGASGGECRVRPPEAREGRSFPQVRLDDWCGMHPQIDQLLARSKRKRVRRPEPEVVRVIDRDSLIDGTYDAMDPKELGANEAVLKGLMAVLGKTQGDKVFALSKRRRSAMKQAFVDGVVPSQIAKAFEGWQLDPTGWWNGEARGEDAKRPDPLTCLKHVEKFQEFWETHEGALRDAQQEEEVPWLLT